ncbi:hypothetical protein B0O99DRAFT_597792 [Bisporella sp. PMI_857]|nr:hypothetical protein B0O99DRAFT_597792 [Bisporella sp. PMI_857]
MLPIFCIVCLSVTFFTILATQNAVTQKPFGLIDMENERSLKTPVSPLHTRTFEAVDIDFSWDEPILESSSALLKYLASPDAPHDQVRKLSVTGNLQEGNWTLFTAVLEQLLQLEEFHWTVDHALPPRIFHFLTTLPKCRLYYTTAPKFDRSDYTGGSWIEAFTHPPQSPVGLELLIGSPILYSLTSSVRYGRHPNLLTLDLIFRVLSSCPNLRELDLSLARFGCVVSGGQPYAFNFRAQPGARFPPLEKLSLSGYDKFQSSSSGGKEWEYKILWPWPERTAWRKSWPWYFPSMVVDGLDEVMYTYLQHRQIISKWWSAPPPPDPKTNIDAWLEVMDWSNIHTLALCEPHNELLEKLQGDTIPRLRHLTLTRGYRTSANSFLNFLSNTRNSLESLSIQYHYFCLEPLIKMVSSHHATGLQTLHVHQSGALSPMKDTELSQLLMSCTILRNLEIDMPRPLVSLASLSIEPTSMNIPYIMLRNSSVTSLKLHYASLDRDGVVDEIEWEYEEIEQRRNDDVLDPEINRESVKHMFEFLRHGIDDGMRLERLEVLVGEWEARYEHGGTMPRQRRRVARLEVLGNADQIVEVGCDKNQLKFGRIGETHEGGRDGASPRGKKEKRKEGRVNADCAMIAKDPSRGPTFGL